VGRVTGRDQEVINQLIVDCNMYNLNEKESLEYIKQRLGKEISGRTYRRYCKHIGNDEATQNWINQYTKIGFLITHKEIMDVIDTLQKDTLRDYLTENSKPYEEKNHSRIQMYRNLLRENSKLLSDLSAGSPIISQVKARIDEAESRANQISPALSISNETDSSWR
jgi:hypothetical protein